MNNNLMEISDEFINDVALQANAWYGQIEQIIDEFENEMDSGGCSMTVEQRYNTLDDMKNAIERLMSLAG